MSMFQTVADFELALANLPAPDDGAGAQAAARQAELTKPAGSLGKLEDIALFMAGWQGTPRPSAERIRIAVFAGNHGVTAHGVSAFPPEVTAQMVANFKAGGAAINALAGALGAELKVVALELERPTADFTQAPAMSEAECLAALSAGAAMAEEGIDLLILGEMGIGNSTAASALCLRSFGGGVERWIGPGTGIDREGKARKLAVVEQALAFHATAPFSPFETLRRVGGREIVAMAGAVLAARQRRIPVLLDGFICCSAVAPLAAAVPEIAAHCLAGHCSAEPGHVHLLAHLGLEPLLRLDMRLGEASGAAVAVHIVRSALAAHNQMATFAEAAVAGAL